MTSNFLKLYPNSSTDTNESNNGTKAIIEGQSPISSIVSANNSLTNKGKSNPHHHFIFTKDPFRTIIKNIRSNDETTNINTKLSDHAVVKEKNVNLFNISIINYHSLPTNASITELDIAHKYNNNTTMINSEDDNKSHLIVKQHNKIPHIQLQIAATLSNY